jgi:hypothetical protein
MRQSRVSLASASVDRANRAGCPGDTAAVGLRADRLRCRADFRNRSAGRTPCTGTGPSTRSGTPCGRRDSDPRRSGTFEGRHRTSTRRRAFGQVACGILLWASNSHVLAETGTSPKISLRGRNLRISCTINELPGRARSMTGHYWRETHGTMRDGRLPVQPQRLTELPQRLGVLT